MIKESFVDFVVTIRIVSKGQTIQMNDKSRERNTVPKKPMNELNVG